MSLLCSVPQGSVLSPLVFSIYSKTICDIAHKHGIKIHLCADDTLLYLSFDVSGDVLECLKKMEECVAEIRKWIKNNVLKLNDGKTEIYLSFQPTFSLICYVRFISELLMLVFKLVSQHVTLV